MPGQHPTGSHHIPPEQSGANKLRDTTHLLLAVTTQALVQELTAGDPRVLAASKLAV